MADHLRRRLVSPDPVLLLVEEGEARHEVTGHQVCVLDGSHRACQRAQQDGL